MDKSAGRHELRLAETEDAFIDQLMQAVTEELVC